MIDNIWILGGEPLDNNILELLDLLNIIYKTNKIIWLWTRYEIEEIPEDIIEYCNYIKTGEYVPELSVDDNIQYGIKLLLQIKNI